MTSERWRQIEQVYHAALAYEADGRAGYLAEVCAGDEDLRREVESLLGQDPSSPALVFNRASTAVAGQRSSSANRLHAGARLGPYEIEGPLGVGGMAEVWKARDTRLGRLVALKVSKTDFSRRFELEARAVAALNHPHICTLYDVGPNYLVMECVEGKPLQELIPRNGLPLPAVLNYAVQIADALTAAHAAGIVHRDLKPGNILITAEGSVKVVDFGLARVVVTGLPDPGDSNPLTAKGEIVGTVCYMSPEQAEGRSVDVRSDIFSFGSVLYEMLTGARAFRGSSVASTLANIIHIDPRPPHELAGALSRDLETLLARCLRKDPARRWQSMADVKVALLDLKEDSAARAIATSESSPGRPRRRSTMVGILASILAVGGALATGVLAFVHFGEQSPRVQVLQYTLPLPEQTSDLREFALSPDGHYLVMDAGGDAVSHRLWLRALDNLRAEPLAGTEEATYPFWSPDSRWIAFFSGDKLKKIPVNGGPVQTLCNAPIARGGSWGRSGVIVFSADNGNNGLSRVAESGGIPTPATKIDTGTNRWPCFLPDGRRFLYLSARGHSNGIHLASLDSSEDKRLVGDESNPAYAPPLLRGRFGLLLFVRERTLMAQPVDPNTLKTEGELFAVAEQVSRGQNNGSNLYSLSSSGLLAYKKGSAGENRQYIWVDRNGKQTGRASGVVRSINSFSVSPDGKWLAAERPSDSGLSTDLWLTDLEHSRESRLTFDPSLNSSPVFSPDGRQIAFQSSRGDGMARIYVRLSNHAGSDELLFESKPGVAPMDWSHNGKYLIFRPTQGAIDLLALPVVGPKRPVRLVASPRIEENDSMAQLSPDGRWLAYMSNASGLFQIMVQAFDPAQERPQAAKWQISIAGGTQPRWRADGKELFYMAPDGKLMSVEVKATPQNFEHGTPRALFVSRADAPTGGISWSYVPSADGSRFLVRAPVAAPEETPVVTVVVNWLANARK